MNHLLDWTAAHASGLGTSHVLASHRLAEHGLFTDEALLRVFDTHPADHLLLYTMGTDPSEPDDFSFGLRGDATAEELLEAVRSGRLWLNILRMQEFHDDWRRLLDELYAEVEAGTPGFRTLRRSSNLLVSSPRAMVYYHADAPLNMLWHVRGHKQVRVYPDTERFVSREALERIFSGETEEEVPYDPAFEADATVYDLEPGQVLTWPQNMAHRVENGDDLNVSLSTEHWTEAAGRKRDTYLANYYLRRWFRLAPRSVETDTAAARAKRLAYRAGRHLLPAVDEFEDTPDFVVDPAAPDRVRWLTERPAFARR